MVHADTEIIVAPRTRDAASSSLEMPPSPKTSVKGKEKEKLPSIRLRLAPPGVAAAWGDLSLSDDDLKEAGDIALCSWETLARARRKLRLGEHDTPWVKLTKPVQQQTTADPTPPPVSDGAQDSAEPPFLEVRLLEWDPAPSDTLVILGKVDETWQTWSPVKVLKAEKRKRPSKPHKAAASAYTL